MRGIMCNRTVAYTAGMATDFDSLYAAFNARDIDAALAGMHPEVDWPNGWEGGRVHGRDGNLLFDTTVTHVYATDDEGLVTRMEIVD